MGQRSERRRRFEGDAGRIANTAAGYTSATLIDITNRVEALIQPFFLAINAAIVSIIALAIYLP